MSRSYPALDITSPSRPDSEEIGLWLAEVDDEGPTAVEEREFGARIFFATALARGRAAVKLIALEPDLACEPIEVPDEDWAERSQASLTSVRIGRFVIAPPWEEDGGRSRDADVQRDGAYSANASLVTVVIVIQPSMGFGTGHHASTRLCLRLLQEVPLTKVSVLDVGTGSGVLAIAAAKLGASRVTGIDNDADALTSAQENIARNHSGDVITLTLNDLTTTDELRGPFDLITANLTGGLLLRLAPSLASLLSPDGLLIVSGLTTDEETEVIRAFATADLGVKHRMEEEGWLGIGLQRVL